MKINVSHNLLLEKNTYLSYFILTYLLFNKYIYDSNYDLFTYLFTVKKGTYKVCFDSFTSKVLNYKN